MSWSAPKMAPTLLGGKKKCCINLMHWISFSTSSHQKSQLFFFSSVPKIKGTKGSSHSFSVAQLVPDCFNLCPLKVTESKESSSLSWEQNWLSWPASYDKISYTFWLLSTSNKPPCVEGNLLSSKRVSHNTHKKFTQAVRRFRPQQLTSTPSEEKYQRTWCI